MKITKEKYERTLKLTGNFEEMNINGQYSVDLYNINNFSLASSPYVVFNKHGYTKHYYVEADRIASKIGGGMGHSGNNFGEHVDAFDVDYAVKAELSYKQANDHLHYAQSDLSKQFDYIVDVDYRPIRDVMYIDDPESKIFYFHKDHLGSSTQISDINQSIVHHIEYIPTGELFAEQRDHWATPYKFNGKELDEETGYYYYGARYYTPELGIWLSVDPLSDKFPHQSNYMYCSGRPVTVVDPDGRDEWEVNYGTGKISKVNENKHYVNDKGNRIIVKQGEEYSGSEDLSKYTQVDRLSNKNGESIDLTKGVLGLKQTNEDSYQSFSMSTHSEAEKMYYFWAESTKSEVAMCLLNNGSGHVGTDYNSDYTTMPRRYENAYGSSVSLMSHSHTDGSPPSNTVIGMGGKIGGDLYAAKYSKYSFNREVYDVQNARIYMYNRDTLDDLKLRNRSVKDIPWRKKN